MYQGKRSVPIDEELLYLYNRGKYYHAYNTFGAQPIRCGTEIGVRFVLWAPGAAEVRVVGGFNDWGEDGVLMEEVGTTGVYIAFVPGIGDGELYKYLIKTKDGRLIYKADPFAVYAERRPGTASVVRRLDYKWHDARWMTRRRDRGHFERPKNIYEVHLGSWRRHEPDAGNEEGFYTYRELAEELVPYVREMGYTHIELLPVMEHPLDASWGYQVTGYYAATSRYGTPEDLMYLIDCCHKSGIGVIIDWVPGHFCRDDHGLGRFCGEPLYERGDHRQWGTYKFDFKRSEVRSFLLSNAMFWLDKFHADGLRVDGVSSMIYLNFGAEPGEEKVLNADGGEEDPDAISFLRELANITGVYFPGVFTVAEESSAFPLVTYPPSDGGLGFHYKWDMGWMNDTLKYMNTGFPERPSRHTLLTFSMMYAFNENFILPLSHDEVVHGKLSLIGRMPGEYQTKFAGLRLLMMYQMTHSGGKLNFMGNEFGQFIEWRDGAQLDWLLLAYESHRQHREFVRALNDIYISEKSFWMCDHDWNGFEWIDANNAEQGVLIYLRSPGKGRTMHLVVLNFQPEAREGFRVGVPKGGVWREIINSEDPRFGGGGGINPGIISAQATPWHGRTHSIEITLPPMGGAIFKKVPNRQAPSE